MSLTEQGVHYPANPDKFDFDAEVTAVFDDMALRSIPMYDEAHRLNADLVSPYLCDPDAVVCDVGASTGRLVREISRVCGSLFSPTLYAVEPSHSMCEVLHRTRAYDKVICAGLPDAPDLPKQATVIFAYYVLQFIHPSMQYKALEWMARNLAPGGCIVFGHKTTAPVAFADALRCEYYAFRQRNGYTMDEIEAKAKALAGSMWPVEPATFLLQLHKLRFSSSVETSRWVQFATYIVRKPRDGERG